MILIAAFSVTACKNKEKKKIVIAEQYGLAYAPLQIIRANGILEELLPDTDVSWVRLGNTAAIREAAIAGKVDVGFLGIPPFLISRDKGMNWKIFSGLSRASLGLVADTRKKDSLDSLLTNSVIALPQPGSIQHILLSMAADRIYGDYSIFDNNLMTMKHPDGMNALLSGSIDAHFTSPPFIFQETETKIENQYPYKTILTGGEAFGGEFTFIVGVVTAEFAEEEPELLNSFKTALAEGMDIINSRPEEASRILSKEYDIDRGKILEYLKKPGTAYTAKIQGLDQFIEFLEKTEYLDNKILSEEVILK